MISESAKYYGVVIVRIVDGLRRRVNIQRIPESPMGFYWLDGYLPIYIKYSTHRRGPWVFNYQASHRALFKKFTADAGCGVASMVCGSDGIVALDNLEFGRLFGEYRINQAAVSVRRRLNKRFRVKGPACELDRTFARGRLVDLVGSYLDS